jgi:predicted ABC-type ATPase
VFSHPSKLDLIDDALRAGYQVALHVVMAPEDVSVARVAYRVRSGGHDVPAEKIRERHRRLWGLVAEAVERTTTASFWDNSNRAGPRMVALLSDGLPVGDPSWPTWTDVALTARWPSPH